MLTTGSILVTGAAGRVGAIGRRDGLLALGLPVHLVNHLATIADLHPWDTAASDFWCVALSDNWHPIRKSNHATERGACE